MRSFLRALPDALQPLLPLAGIVWLLIHGLTARTPELETPGSLTAFRAAIVDSAVRTERNVYGGLVPIRADNNDLVWRTPDRKELLVVTFVTTAAADKFYRNADGSGRKGITPENVPRIWVTLAPELRRFCQRLGIPDPTDRLKQYLGLSPTNQNDLLVEMWVARDDLFRPCPDPEVSDSACSLQTTDPPPTVKNIPDYAHFLLSLHEKSYRVDGAPWTGLGYTYDWAHGEHGIGASEYMLVPKAAYEVRSVQQPSSYCAGGATVE
jgi:hypothetical protein